MARCLLQQTGYRAKHRYARMTARKARLIADQIRGQSVNEALELLEFAPQRAAAILPEGGQVRRWRTPRRTSRST